MNSAPRPLGATPARDLASDVPRTDPGSTDDRLQRFLELRHNPRVWAGALAVMCVALLAMRQSFLLRASSGLTPMQTSICVGVILLCAGAIFGKDRIPRPPVVPLLVVLTAVVVAMASYAAAASHGLTPAQVVSADRGLLGQVIMLATFLLVVTVVRSRTAVVWILRGLLIGGAISALYALLQTATGFDIAPYMRIPVILKGDTTTLVTGLMRAGTVRPQGAAGHPLELSAVLTALTPIAIGVAFEARHRGERWWPWALTGGIIAFGAFATVSRSAIVGMGIAALVFALVSPIRRTLVAAIASLAVLAISYILQFSLLTGLSQVLSEGSKDNSLESRSFGADYVTTHFPDHLWLGQGLGTYDLKTQPVLDNEYLSRLMEVGLLGMATFAAIFITGAIAAGIAVIRAMRAHDRGRVDLAAGVLAGIAVIGVIATILDVNGFAQISMLMILLVALASVLMRGADEAF